MRDLIVMLTFLAMLFPVFLMPHAGVLLWSWFAFMNPHREVYGFAQEFQFNFIIAILTMVAWLLSNESKKIPLTLVTFLIFMFAALVTLTTFAGSTTDYSHEYWVRNMKTLILVFAVLAMVNTRTRIHSLIWIIVISLGYFGVKGGAFMIVTGGQYRLWGPAGSMIYDNNHLATALVMSLPLINYVRMESKAVWVRRALFLALVLTAFAVLGSYSRGGFLALAGLLMVFWWRSNRKVVSMIVVVVLGAAALSFMPAQFFERMGTIETATDEDSSFIGRLEAWQTAVNIASRAPLGVGFRAYQNSPVWQQYAPPEASPIPRAIHSIYFEVLADHGYAGLAIFLLVGFLTWRSLRRVVKATKDIPELRWAQNLAIMLELSIAGYAIGGAALSLAYYDVYWVIVAATVSLRLVVAREIAASTDNRFVPSAFAMGPQPVGTTARVAAE